MWEEGSEVQGGESRGSYEKRGETGRDPRRHGVLRPSVVGRSGGGVEQARRGS